MIKLKNLSSKKTPESDADDWVTIGVLVDKLPPRCVDMYVCIVLCVED